MLQTESRRFALPSNQIRAFLGSRWAVMFWAACVGVAIASSIVITPRQFDEAVSLTDIPLGDRETMRRSLEGLRLTPAFVAWAQLVTVGINFLVTILVAWLLLQRRPRAREPESRSFSDRVDGRNDDERQQR